jgi:hypothetical protein
MIKGVDVIHYRKPDSPMRQRLRPCPVCETGNREETEKRTNCRTVAKPTTQGKTDDQLDRFNLLFAAWIRALRTGGKR